MPQLTADVAVIGGGIAGASVTAEIAREASVILLEAEDTLGIHSTGRSAASYLPSYGTGAVQRLTLASRTYFAEMSEEFGLPMLTPRHLVWLASDSSSERAVDQLLVDNGHLVAVDADQACALCPALKRTAVSRGAVDPSAMDVDVAALHRSYLVMLKRRGGVLQRSARVRRVRAARGAWTIDAGDVQVSCGRIVNAAGAWVDEVAAAAGVPGLGIQAKRRTVCVSPHAYNGRSEHWPIVIDGLERWYFKPEGPHILLSPADETDVPPGDARPDALAIGMALDAVREVTSLQLRSVTRSWAGLRSFVPDRSPVIGSWSEYPGFDFLAGQGGYGIQMGPALAVLAADLVLHQTATTWSAAFGVDPRQLAPARLSADR